MDEQPTRKEHQKGKINKSPSLLGKASCLPPVLFCPDNGPPPSLHQTLVVAYDSRNDDLSSYFHIKDVNVVYYCCEPATTNVRHQHQTSLKRKASRSSRSAIRDSFHPCFCRKILSLYCWASLLNSMLISAVTFMRNKLFSPTRSSRITVNGKNLLRQVRVVASLEKNASQLIRN